METKLPRVTSRREAEGAISLLQPTIEKIKTLRRGLEVGLVGRSDEAEIITLALASGKNAVLIGDSGTAKSGMTLRLRKLIDGNVFYYQLHKSTQDYELLGHLDPKELRDGRYVRITGETLLTAHVAILDEIFEGSSFMLNALRAALQERVFSDAGVLYPIGLHSTVGTSNVVPDEVPLQAFYDRFLYRGFVESVGTQGKIHGIMLASQDHVWSEERTKPVIGIEELRQFKEALAELRRWIMPLTTPENEPSDLARLYVEIINQIGRNGLHVSDRTHASVQEAVAASALIMGRSTADAYDLRVLRYIVPHDLEEARIVNSVLSQYLNPDKMLPSDIIQLGKFLSEAISEVRDPDKVPEEQLKLLRDGVRTLEQAAHSPIADEAARVAMREYNKIQNMLRDNLPLQTALTEA